MRFYNEKIGVIATRGWASELVNDTMSFAFTRDGFATPPLEFTIPMVNNNRMVFHFLDSDSFLCLGSDGFVVKVDMSQGGSSVMRVTDPDLDFQIYPNPATDEIHVKYSTNSAGTVAIELWDEAGKKTKSLSSSIELAGTHSHSFPLPKDLHGTFFLHLTSDGVLSERLLEIR